MSADMIRATCYVDPAMHRALWLKAASTHRTMSEIVDDALREALREDGEGLAAFAERADEKTLSYKAFLAQLEADGALS